MSVSPVDFLESAKLIENTGKTEIDFRNCASRAYYSAFHACQMIAETLHGSPFNGGSHQKVILALQNSGKSEYVTLGNRLNQFKEIRVHADYDLSSAFLPGRAKLAIKLASRIIDDLSPTELKASDR